MAGKAFDRRVVAVLVNYLKKRGGRAEWASYGEPLAAETGRQLSAVRTQP
ncbi:MAG: hypothetical protein ACE5JZ_08255 [Kiloniellales bacterium]